MLRRRLNEVSRSDLILRRTFWFGLAVALVALATIEATRPVLAAPTITVNPNPVLVPEGKTEGTATLAWDAGVDWADSRVWLQVDSGKEDLFAASAKGTSEIKVVMDRTYTFRLYSGDGTKVLASIVVKARRPDPPKPSLPKVPASASGSQPGYLYGVLPDGTLTWYRHDGRGRGTNEWQGPRDITTGLKGLKHAFAGGNYNVFYSIAPDGNLKRFSHSFTDDAGDLPTKGSEVPRNVGNGWQNFKHVFSAGGGSIYVVAQDGVLKWYRYIPVSWVFDKPWDGPKDMGSGWGNFKTVFSTGEGVIYAITPEGKLLWFKHNFYKYGVSHEGFGANGQPAWEGPREVGTGWQNFKHVFSPGDGVIYAATKEGNLVWYKHQGYLTGAKIWLGPRDVWRSGWDKFDHAFALLNEYQYDYSRKPSSLKVLPPVFSSGQQKPSFFTDLIIQPASDGALISFSPAADCKTLIQVSTAKPLPLPETVRPLPSQTKLFQDETNVGLYCNQFFSKKEELLRRNCRINGKPNTTYYFVIMAATFNDAGDEYDSAYYYSGSFTTKAADTIRPRIP